MLCGRSCSWVDRGFGQVALFTQQLATIWLSPACNLLSFRSQHEEEKLSVAENNNLSAHSSLVVCYLPLVKIYFRGGRRFPRPIRCYQHVCVGLLKLKVRLPWDKPLNGVQNSVIVNRFLVLEQWIITSACSLITNNFSTKLVNLINVGFLFHNDARYKTT